MLEVKEVLTGNISVKESLTGELTFGTKNVYPSLTDLEVTPSEEVQTFKHEDSYGYDNVIVNAIPEEYIIPSGTKEINTNGTHDVNDFKNVSVNISTSVNLQTKEITPTKEMQVVGADEEYDGLDAVVVNAVTNEIDSNIQPNNIKDGVTILGVAGTLQEGSSASVEGTTLVFSSGSVEEGELRL